MMTLKKRIDELEKKTGSKEPYWIIVQYEGAEPTEAQEEAAIADYKAKHPDWKKGDFMVLYWKDGQFKGGNSTH